ncbi:hypothetical protein [Bacillus safensis]|uniref:hypothetical protein n=1 Tax=Bacillus safensis TaxID=561879 RepID=UPI002E1EF1CB|nr:hypothetical protein [Bacillus safensis]
MDKAMAYIDKLAAKLGVAAEHVYGVLVEQAVADGISNVIIGVAVITVLIVALSAGKKAFVKSNVSVGWDFLDWSMLTVFVGLVMVIGFGFGLSILTDGIKATINPEYYAIKELLDTIGGK